MKKIFSIIFCFVLSSCCSAEKYNALLDSRLGMTENDLIDQIGNPSSIYDKDGKRSLEYKYTNTHCDPFECETDWCTTQYIIKDGKVDKWQYKGNSCCPRDYENRSVNSSK